MDNYFEQNVAGERGPRQQLTYAIVWVVLVLSVIVAITSTAGIVSPDPEGISINWMNVIMLVISAGLAIVVYRIKDRVYKEYDYILWNSEFEIHAVYNRRSRKKVATLQLNRVAAWGPAGAMEGRMRNAKKRNFCVHSDRAWCLLFSGEGGGEAFLLELSEEMCAQLRALDRSMRAAEVRA